jgi:hypothetical protein
VVARATNQAIARLRHNALASGSSYFYFLHQLFLIALRLGKTASNQPSRELRF